MKRALPRRISQFPTAEDGSMTLWGLFLLTTMAAVAASALDVSYLLSSRSHLQVAADSAAHAALYLRDTGSEDAARAGAVSLVEDQFPPDVYGAVLDFEDIEFGSWDMASATFTAGGLLPNAARVVTGRTAEDFNPVQSFLFRLVGMDTFDIRADAVFETYRPMCLTEGFVADDVVDIQSNNTYGAGFCLHSNNYISLNSNNIFEEGSVVSMPDVNDIDLPRSGWESNEGLAAALRSGSYRLRVLNRLDAIIDELLHGGEAQPDYITSTSPTYLADYRLDASDFTPGRVYYKDCHHGRITITNDAVLREVVLVTNCEIKFEQGVTLEDVVIATSNEGDRSLNAPATFQVGRNDGCAPGGGAQLITKGGMNFAADLRLYNGQLIAKKDIIFTANADGIQGASLVAGGEISGTANMYMAHCGTGMEDNIEEDYFRLVD